MKFIYVDESGDKTQGDMFVMVGLLVDAYRLRKATAEFDKMIVDFLEKHPNPRKELKAKALINGADKWSKVAPGERKQFIADICGHVCGCMSLYPVAFSMSEFESQCESGNHDQPFKSHWLGAALFIASVVQQKMLKEERNKGHTVFICDDHKVEMPKLSDALYDPSGWFDPIYQESRSKGGKKVVVPVQKEDRFSNIINTGFAIKSEHSSLVQVADAVAYVYRRHLELKSQSEAWEGERAYFDELAEKLDSIRERLGSHRTGPCVDFYKAVKSKHWTL
jgi:hypothetical protein